MRREELRFWVCHSLNWCSYILIRRMSNSTVFRKLLFFPQSSVLNGLRGKNGFAIISLSDNNQRVTLWNLLRVTFGHLILFRWLCSFLKSPGQSNSCPHLIGMKSRSGISTVRPAIKALNSRLLWRAGSTMAQGHYQRSQCMCCVAIVTGFKKR